MVNKPTSPRKYLLVMTDLDATVALSTTALMAQVEALRAADRDALPAHEQAADATVGYAPSPRRMVMTVLFIDIVDSTQRVLHLGDQRWQALQRAFFKLSQTHVERFQGRMLDRAGDGFLAAFDGPSQAVCCACTLRTELRRLGLFIRGGIHAGEVEVSPDQVSGIAVHIGARIAAQAAPDEILSSHTARDLATGADLLFSDRGTHGLKGIPGRWPLFAVDLEKPRTERPKTFATRFAALAQQKEADTLPTLEFPSVRRS